MTAPSGEAALANAREVDTYDVGYCQKYVREAWRIGALYGSALDAWYGAVRRHPGDRSVPTGAPMFYSGGKYGHVVIDAKNNPIRSTDCPSPGRVSETDIDWPVRNWGCTYLGWTEDLNGVDLPLGEEDEMNEDDWKRLRNIVREEVWEKSLPVDKPDGSETKKKASQQLREILQRVQK
jgi:hypothetical protein